MALNFVNLSSPRDCIDASRVIKNLYLGSYQGAAKLEEGLKLLGITYILSIGDMDKMTVPDHVLLYNCRFDHPSLKNPLHTNNSNSRITTKQILKNFLWKRQII
jgi:hypothetical protein